MATPLRSVMQYRYEDGNLETTRIDSKFIEGRSPEQLHEEFYQRAAYAAENKQTFFYMFGIQFETDEYYVQNLSRLRKTQPTYPVFKTLDQYFEEYKVVA